MFRYYSFSQVECPFYSFFERADHLAGVLCLPQRRLNRGRPGRTSPRLRIRVQLEPLAFSWLDSTGAPRPGSCRIPITELGRLGHEGGARAGYLAGLADPGVGVDVREGYRGRQHCATNVVGGAPEDHAGRR